MKKLILPFLLIYSLHLFAQKYSIKIINQGTNTNLRGLSVINENIVWASGSNGKIARSIDGGKSWQWTTPKGFAQSDFRDIEGINKNTAIIMAIDSPAYILKTTDGGNSWRVVYKSIVKGMFLDALDFCNHKKGIVAGDPINGKIFLATTNNSGESWQNYTTKTSGEINKGEAFFAASGTNISFKKKTKFFLVSGGTKSRLFTKNKIFKLPIMQGSPTSGANAIAVYKKNIAIAGGDFMQPTRNDSCFCFSKDNGKTWALPKIAPGGYKSDVIFINEYTLICCGLTGVDISKDGGNSWKNISRHSFNTCQYNKESNTVFFVGQNGTIGKMLL